ncbi:MAG TPA: NAD(P)H-dependent glycerol-3-phosphate dehydrogenase [Kiritimatiellia bacterium]|nr:NAD(P)H-dependent glycerol-3-phosphate dehydrogenase [Kiritimatiellia bacterium]HMO99228.1 NAD(P)H-dependent glycerol-3-phosphate dehydrogenase [Kiritimatiellia bacterium]HMP97484.1 NAD(P)H-dependent glycerol-3-phosphate dehydrogenase [Kiritimatiellia bacterium]
MSTITIIGDGGWGTALGIILHGNGHKVTLWGPDAAYLEEVRTTGENRKFLPGLALPPGLQWTADEATALNGADGMVIAVPSRYYAATLQRFAPHLPSRYRAVSVSKGFDPATHQRLSALAAATWNHAGLAALSGPSHAEEAARGVPTAVTVASTDNEEAVFWQDAFNNRTFRVYTTDDIIGVETGGALKNVIAIAAGMCDGLGYGDNTKAALMTRGLAEIARLGVRLGAQPATFSGLSGIGDLMVTGMSRHSRNRGVGERIGRGESIDAILGGMVQVAEGVWTARAACQLADELGLELPITREVHAILYEGKNPREAVQSLMSRPPKPE